MAATGSSGLEMNQETAQALFRQGGTLVFLDVPEGTEFGIDYNSWTVGPRFRGVKMIPPGVHFVYYSAVNSDKQAGPRSGFFHNFKKGEVLIKHWSQQNEDILHEEIQAEEQERIEQNKEDLDSFLGVYPYESYKKWVSLTDSISDEVMQLLQPQLGYVHSAAQFVSEKSNSKDRMKAALEAGEPSIADVDEDSRLPQMDEVPGTFIRFSKILSQKYPQGASPTQVTKYNMDHSYVLEQLLERYHQEGDLLGELQFAFICFVVGQNYDSFEHWKKLVRLLSSCDEGIGKHPELFMNYMTVLHYQTKEVPEDFFVDIVSRENFLVQTLHNFLENLKDSDCPENVKNRGIKFRDHLQKRFNWDFTSDLEDEQPVVVE